MGLHRKTIFLLLFYSFMSVGWGQDCIEGVEVELWGECYNIEETIELNYSYITLGEIPSSIGELTNLHGNAAEIFYPKSGELDASKIIFDL